MILQKALEMIENEHEFAFHVLRNINTGENLYFACSEDGDTIVITKLGLSKEEKNKEDYWENEWEYKGKHLDSLKWTIDNVNSHQWGVHHTNTLPITRLYKGIVHYTADTHPDKLPILSET